LQVHNKNLVKENFIYFKFFSLNSYNYINVNSINQIIAKRKSLSQDITLQLLQAQLWIGLREMVRLYPESIQVKNCDGEDILSRWRTSEPKTPQMAELNQTMITWLQSCATNNWKLI